MINKKVNTKFILLFQKSWTCTLNKMFVKICHPPWGHNDFPEHMKMFKSIDDESASTSQVTHYYENYAQWW